MGRYKTKKEATEAWVAEFNAIPLSMLQRLVDIDIDEWQIHYSEDENGYAYSTFPTWGTVWSFGDSMDDYWLEEKDGIKQMTDLGFIVLEHDEYGYWFGVDAGGFDFYEGFWIPLYEARGLQWHESEVEDDNS